MSVRRKKAVDRKKRGANAKAESHWARLSGAMIFAAALVTVLAYFGLNGSKPAATTPLVPGRVVLQHLNAIMVSDGGPSMLGPNVAVVESRVNSAQDLIQNGNVQNYNADIESAGRLIQNGNVENTGGIFRSGAALHDGG